MRSNVPQVILIAVGLLVTALFGAFFYRELFPEYRIYQHDYVALEQFRSTYTLTPPPLFSEGVKQIVLEREDRGPPVVDRCTSCHVALQIPYFSPTKIAHDMNGNLVRDADGRPVLVDNDDYIWGKLDASIAALRDEKVIEQLKSQGDASEIKRRLAQAEKYESLKVAKVGEHEYDVTQVLRMHPLMGRETRPFEFHPLEEYGCTSCHNGNGNGLVTDKAHGPVFDGKYDVEYRGAVPRFTEPDQKNDPKFSRVFNDKPGHELLFQTQPIYVGGLIEAKCVQCHLTSDTVFQEADSEKMIHQKLSVVKLLLKSYEQDLNTVVDLLLIRNSINSKGYEQTVKAIEEKSENYTLPSLDLEHYASQLTYLKDAKNQQTALMRIEKDLQYQLGSIALVELAEKEVQTNGEKSLSKFLKIHSSDPSASGALFAKGTLLDFNDDIVLHAEDMLDSHSSSLKNQKLLNAITSDVDEMTTHFNRGKQLYIAQACYACHRISPFSRGGVGPELTREGEAYPWYIKQKMVWPQSDLKTSTMPNMRLDSSELEDLMTFLLAQKGPSQAVSKSSYRSVVQSWEAGRKMEWEEPLDASKIHDINHSMMIFATEGCASCHRLKGFTSAVGFKEEQGKNSNFSEKYANEIWFKKLFPEVIHLSQYDESLPGSELVAVIEKFAKEIDVKILSDARKKGVLEKIEQSHPELIESYYSPFRYASRAKDDEYRELIKHESDPKKKEHYELEHRQWKERVHRVLMMYVQTYGLGRLIGPHLNWSGIYRSDEWLMEHFKNPASHVPKSIMPVMPFDESKFYALTYMLDQLAISNRNETRQIWAHRGFDPEEAYGIHCAQCHGISMLGNGAIAEWIYPIPKNLHNSDFLRNLTKEQAMRSIKHGVKGTPMPPWGEVAQDKPKEIESALANTPVLKENEIGFIVDWLFSTLAGAEVIKSSSDVPKWQYEPVDVIEELKKEGGTFTPKQEGQKQPGAAIDHATSLLLEPTFESYPIAMVDPAELAPNRREKSEVLEIFDEEKNPLGDPKENYMIKKKYYTDHNIHQGQKFFLLNCAVCHGSEADGTGARAEAMQDAKPRMLTNLDWIQSKDDMRLLRSIKFGVPGTSMTPWGDMTSSLQRLQLVMYIRTLSEERERRDGLDQALYQAFDQSQFTLDSVRSGLNEKLDPLKAEQASIRSERETIQSQMSNDQHAKDQAVLVYQRELNNQLLISQLASNDQLLVNLKKLIKSERDLFQSLGISLIQKNVSNESLKDLELIIRLLGNRFEQEGQKIKGLIPSQHEEEIRSLSQKILKELDSKRVSLEDERKRLMGRISDASTREEINENKTEVEQLEKLKMKVINGIEEAFRLEREQDKIVNQYNERMASRPELEKAQTNVK